MIIFSFNSFGIVCARLVCSLALVWSSSGICGFFCGFFMFLRERVLLMSCSRGFEWYLKVLEAFGPSRIIMYSLECHRFRFFWHSSFGLS